jgi:CBS domain containing-hemolysin-like protein
VTWLLLLLGLGLAFAGSAGAAALVTTARGDLARAISRRLRGGNDSLAWLAVTERQVVAATATASFGVALVGCVIPGVFAGVTLPQLGLLLVFLVVPATLLGGHLLPRWLTSNRAERAVEVLRPALRGAGTVLQLVLPARATDPGDEVRALAREGLASGMGEHELVMVGGVMSFAERPVREVMTPRTELVALPHDVTWDDALLVFSESGYTRLPVYRSTLDEIVGMVHAFDLFKHQPHDPLPLRPVSFSPESRPAGDVLLEMQRERQHFTVVVDEFGGTAGVVTLEDLLEALVGEIADEDEAPPAPRAPGSELLELDGAAPPSTVAVQFGVTLPAVEAASFGGLLAELAGRIPAAGEQFRLCGLLVEVLQASPTRVERLVVRRDSVAPVNLDLEPR